MYVLLICFNTFVDQKPPVITNSCLLNKTTLHLEWTAPPPEGSSLFSYVSFNFVVLRGNEAVYNLTVQDMEAEIFNFADTDFQLLMTGITRCGKVFVSTESGLFYHKYKYYIYMHICLC